MKRTTVLRAAALLMCAAFAICGCSSDDMPHKWRKAGLSLYIVDENGCKSSLGTSGDDFPEEVSVLIYDSDGYLVRSIVTDRNFSESSNRIDISRLAVGRDYYIYALGGASLGSEDLQNMQTISDAADYAISFSDFMDGGQMLYSYVPEGVIRIENGRNYEIGLKRIAAKYHFIIDQSAMEGRFTARSLAVRQCPAETFPFAGECRLNYDWQAGDGDSADAADIATLNSGGAAHFFVFENLQGNALPGNEDPWEKVPSNLSGGKEGLVSYVEITGSYNATGVSIGTLTYRFILGEDNLNNCDVRRNTVQTITLGLTDENAVIKENWKVTRGVVNDSRQTAFGTDALDIYPYPGRSDTLELTVEPAGLRHRIAIDSTVIDDYPFEVEEDDGRLIINSVSFLPQSKTTAYFPVYISTLDGRVADTLTVAYYSLDRITLAMPYDLYSNFNGYACDGEGTLIPLCPGTATDRSDSYSCLTVNLNYNGVRKSTADTLFERGLILSSSRSGVISADLSPTNPTLWYLAANASGSAKITASYTMDGVTKSGSLTLSPLQLSMELYATESITAGQSCSPYIVLQNNDGELLPYEDAIEFTSSDTGVLSDSGTGISAGTATLEARYAGLNGSCLSDSKAITVRPVTHTLVISTTKTNYYLIDDASGETITVLYDGVPLSDDTGISWNSGASTVISGVSDFRPAICGPGICELSASYNGVSSNSLRYEVSSLFTDIRFRITNLTVQEGSSAPQSWDEGNIPAGQLQIVQSSFYEGETATWCIMHGGTYDDVEITVTVQLYATPVGAGEFLVATKTFTFPLMREDIVDFTPDDWTGYINGRYFDFTARIETF